MFVFKITESDVKAFMGILFKNTIFDFFEVRELEVATFSKFYINGILDKDYLDGSLSKEVTRNYSTWEELKPYVFNIIKGNKRPKVIKIVFSMPIEKLGEIHQNASALFLNIVFENEEIQFTTANSEKVFSMDRSVDGVWDDYIKKFFKDNNIFISTLL